MTTESGARSGGPGREVPFRHGARRNRPERRRGPRAEEPAPRGCLVLGPARPEGTLTTTVGRHEDQHPAPVRRRAAEVAKQAVDLEAAGLDLIWVAEAYGVDAVSIMGYLAAVTERVEIASGILPLYTRTPTLLAMTAAGVDALSGGPLRARPGRLRPAGHRGLPRRALRQAADPHPGDHRDLPPGLEAGAGRVRRQGVHDPAARGPGHRAGQAAEADHPPGPRPHPDPRRRPRPQERRADRRDRRRLAAALLPAREGQGRLGRRPGRRARPSASADLGPLEVVAGGLVAIGKQDEVEALPGLRPPDGRPLRRRHGRQGPATSTTTWSAATASRRRPSEIQDLYLDGKKEEAAAAVPDELLEATTIVRRRGLREGAPRGLPRVRRDHAQHHPVGDAADIVGKLKDWAS